MQPYPSHFGNFYRLEHTHRRVKPRTRILIGVLRTGVGFMPPCQPGVVRVRVRCTALHTGRGNASQSNHH